MHANDVQSGSTKDYWHANHMFFQVEKDQENIQLFPAPVQNKSSLSLGKKRVWREGGRGEEGGTTWKWVPKSKIKNLHYHLLENFFSGMTFQLKMSILKNILLPVLIENKDGSCMVPTGKGPRNLLSGSDMDKSARRFFALCCFRVSHYVSVCSASPSSPLQNMRAP